jgi:hypothetical protein
MKSTRRSLMLSPALLAVQQPASAQEAQTEPQKAKAAQAANLQLLRKVKLKQATEPAFLFKP